MKLQTILRAIRQADQDYSLIEDGDSLAVALSGGKDSMLLFLALSMYQKFPNKNFSLCAIHIDLGNDAQENHLMQDFADQYGLDLHIVKTRIYDILSMDKNRKNGKIQCSLCSNLKKGTLMETAKNLGCNKVVFGHHGDDALETLLMNMIHGARISTFMPIQYMSRMDLTMIRPFAYLKEEEIIKACEQNGIPHVKPVCENDGHSERQRMKEMLASLYEEYPDAHDNFMLALTNRSKDQLWKPKGKKIPNPPKAKKSSSSSDRAKESETAASPLQKEQPE